MSTTETLTLADFLLARIAEDEAPTFELVPYGCPPGCCAPAGWVGHRCLICDDGATFGGTVEAITEISRDHDEKVHQRTHVLAECEAKRQIVETIGTDSRSVYTPFAWEILQHLALPYADHPDYRDEWRV